MKHYLFFPFSLCLLMLAFGSCKKDSSSDSDPDPNPSSSADFYFTGTVDGKKVTIELLPSNDVEMVTANDASLDPPYCTFNYGAYLGPYDPEEYPQIKVDFQQYFSGDCGNEGAVFTTLFPVGSQPFSNAATGGKGVEVLYFDETGVYSSSNGSQTGSQFSITKSETTNFLGIGQTVTGTIECTLYDEFGGKKVLTNGSFRLNFRPWF